LDAWNPFDSNVPEALKITTLPNTIERYMMEERGQSAIHIRRMQDQRARKPPVLDTQKSQKQKDDIDKYCNFCGTFGHNNSNCEIMANLLNANESLNKVDGKLKKELQETFFNEQCQCMEKRLKSKANVI
jgi:hypothetical protein